VNGGTEILLSCCFEPEETLSISEMALFYFMERLQPGYVIVKHEELEPSVPTTLEVTLH
jgi:hypothetical protein